MSYTLVLNSLHVKASLAPVKLMVTASARLQLQNFVNVSQPGASARQAAQRHFCDMLGLYGEGHSNTTVAFYAGLANGDLVGCTYGHGTNASKRFAVLREDSTIQKYQELVVNTATGLKGAVIRTGDDYSATNRPWYKKGVALGQVSATESVGRRDDPTKLYGNVGWSDIYVSTSGHLCISCVVPFYHPWGALIGVIAADVELKFLSKEVQWAAKAITHEDLSYGPALGVIVERDGLVVASSVKASSASAPQP